MPNYAERTKPKLEDYDWIRQQLNTNTVSAVRGRGLSIRVSRLGDQPIGPNAAGIECISLKFCYGDLKIPLADICEIWITRNDVTLSLS